MSTESLEPFGSSAMETLGLFATVRGVEGPTASGARYDEANSRRRSSG